MSDDRNGFRPRVSSGRLRRAGSLLFRTFEALPWVLARRGVRPVVSRAATFVSAGNWQRFFHWLLEAAAYERRNRVADYHRWIRDCEPEAPSAASPCDAVVAVLLPPGCEVRLTLRSLLAQSHVDWILEVTGDEALPEDLRTDPRVRVTSAESESLEGPSRLPAHVEFVLLTHPDCELNPSALALLLAALRGSTAAAAYGDEDEVVDGIRRDPYFKPGFSIDLLRNEDYIGPMVLVRRSELVGANAFDVLLGIYERRGTVAHVPRVVGHWHRRRARELEPGQKRRVSAHLRRCYPVRQSTETRLVSIVIPTRDRVSLLRRCVESIYRHTQREPFEVLVMDNRSEDAETHAWFESALRRYPGLQVCRADYPFNWSRINNEGIAAASGDVLVFLNNDTEVISVDWLDRLATQSRRWDVGTVGALLRYPDSTIQHAGVVLGIGGFADHVYSGIPLSPADRHTFVAPHRTRNVLASTGACLAIRRECIERFGGFDERLTICGDVEMCVRLHEHGLLNVYDAEVELLHHESATRSKAPLPASEIENVGAACHSYVQRGDPFYNRELTLRLRYPSFRRRNEKRVPLTFG